MSTYISCANEPMKIDGVRQAVDYALFTDFGPPRGIAKVGGELVEVGAAKSVYGSYVSLVTVN